MYTLRLSPATIRPTTSSSRSVRRRSPVLKISFIQGTTSGRGGGAMSATMNGEAADAYARALSGAASSADTLEKTLADLEKLSKIFKEPEVPLYFSNQIVSADKKHELIEEIVKNGDFQPQTANFLRVLVDNDRADILPEIAQEFERYYNKFTDTESAVVTSVVRLESEDLAQIAQQVQSITGAKNVRLKTEIDESILGGFTIRYGHGGSKFIDMSVKKQLEDIASQLELPDIPEGVLVPAAAAAAAE
ncbi:hypothetical protein LUZ60_000967 [Juncus effusus]|nr:hypothetical protein LUZ60_000967 [Juncus effusus]